MKRLLSVVVGVCLLQGVLFAQNPPPPPPPPKPAAPAKPAPPPPPPPPAAARSNAAPNTRNIQLALRITDTYSGIPVEKALSLIIRDGHSGRIRTTNVVPPVEAILNVDAETTSTPDGNYVDVSITVDYRPARDASQTNERSIASPVLQQSLTVMLRNGQPLVVSQSADPASERKVTLEVTATILK